MSDAFKCDECGGLFEGEPNKKIVHRREIDERYRKPIFLSKRKDLCDNCYE